MYTLAIICIIILVPSVIIGLYLPKSKINTKDLLAYDTLNNIAREVIEGKWSNGKDRRIMLMDAGYSYTDTVKIQARVNQILTGKSSKTIENFINIRPTLIGISGVLLAFGLLIGCMTVQREQCVGSAVEVTTINTNKNIYYDESTNSYFRVCTRDWNLVNMYYREYIDNDTAEKIIDVAEIVNAWGD